MDRKVPIFRPDRENVIVREKKSSKLLFFRFRLQIRAILTCIFRYSAYFCDFMKYRADPNTEFPLTTAAIMRC